MTKEIENLKQLSVQRDVFRSLADKRKRKYDQFGQQARQESIEMAVRIGEVMDRTLDRRQRLTEKSEELDQIIPAETERISGMIQKLGELSIRNPAVQSAYELYKTEFDEWRGPRIPEVEEVQEELVETGKKETITINFPDGQSFETRPSVPARILNRLKEGPITIGEAAVLIYNEDNTRNRNKISAQIVHARRLAEDKGWTVQKTIIGEGREKKTVFGLRKQEEEQLPEEETGAPEPVAIIVKPTRADYENAIRLIEETGSAADPDTGQPIIALTREHAIAHLRRRIAILPPEPEQPELQVLPSPESEVLQIPEVPELRRIESVHQHKYDETRTVKYALEQVKTIHPSNRTPEQIQLLDDIEYLKRFTTSIRYQEVYSSKELNDLVSRLRKLEGKERVNFDTVEDRLKDHLTLMDKTDSSKWDSPKKTPMQWPSLKRNARRVVSYLATKYQTSSEKITYFMTLRDPEPNKTPQDLSSIYTFVAYDHAIEMIGKRTVSVTDQRKANFMANCETINSWFELAKPYIDRIPSDLKLPTGYGRHTREVSARWLLCDLVDNMNARLNGNAFEGYSKSYRYDVAGAISLQYRIRYTVQELNTMLRSITSEEIIPLEPES